MSTEIKAGLHFERCKKHWQIDEMRIAHDILVCSATDGDVITIAPSTFRKEIVEGEILLLVSDSQGVVHPIENNWMDKETPHARERRIQCIDILNIEAMAVKAGKNFAKALEDVAEHCQKHDIKPPSERTLREWRKARREHESMLSPQWSKCGNRKQGPDEFLLQAIEEVVAVTIASNDRFTITAAWKLIEPRYQELCDEASRVPRRHSIRKLSRYVKAMNWRTLMKVRLDSRTASAITRTAVRIHTANAMWGQVEMDAKFLELRIQDDEGKEIGRPVLYAAIDVATGYPTALHLTIQRPSANPFIECMRYMYFPKPDGFDAQYKILHRIEVYGKPDQLKVDNGSEFIGQFALELIRRMYGDSAQCKPYTPQEKPHVERFNSIIREFVRTLPGSTLSAVTNTMRDPVPTDQLLTMKELTGRLFRYIYDDYAFQVNEMRSWKNRKAVAPHDIVLDMKKQFLEPVPVNRAEFESAMYFKRTTRTLNHDGIALENYTYHSDELRVFYGQHGHGQYDILYSDLDAELIYVVSPVNNEKIPAYAKQFQGLRLDRATAKVIDKEMQADGKALDKRAYKQRLAELTENKISAKSSRGRNKEARKMDLLQQASEAIRPTMLTKKSPVITEPSLTAPQTSWGTKSGSPTGRQRGDK